MAKVQIKSEKLTPFGRALKNPLQARRSRIRGSVISSLIFGSLKYYS